MAGKTPSEIDWLTAAIMAEAATENDQGMAAVADVLTNRKTGAYRPATDYGSSSLAPMTTYQGQFSAYSGANPQFSSYDLAQTKKESGGGTAAHDNFKNALNKGAEGFSGDGVAKYNRARSIAETFIDADNPNYNRYRGITGGSDFFTAVGFPSGRDGPQYAKQQIGNQNFFKLKSFGSFTPYSDPGEKTAPTGLPPAGSDGFGAGYNVSPGVGPGNLGAAGGVLETGNPFDFSGTDVSGGLGTGGPGSNNLGTATPYNGSMPAPPARPSDGQLYPSVGPNSPGPATVDPATPGSGFPGRFSGFNGSSYLAANQDVAAAGMDPIEHFLRFGAKEGRALDLNGTKFDGQSYLAKNRDVALAGMDPLQHYLDYGMGERREAQTIGPGGMVSPIESFLAADTKLPDNYVSLVNASFAPTIGPGATAGTVGPSADAGTVGPSAAAGSIPPPNWFNAADYTAANGDVKAAGADPWTHFQQYGAQEGRALNLDGVHFGAASYLASNPDVAKAGMNPVEHYLKYGAAEGRASPLVDNDSPAQDASRFGFSGFNPSGFGSAPAPASSPAAPSLAPVSGGAGGFKGFDAGQYLGQNQDVAKAGVDPLQHYLNFGYKEGRSLNDAGFKLNDDFSSLGYFAANPDVAKSGMDPLEHYLKNGASEGRTFTEDASAAPYSFSGMTAGVFGGGSAAGAPKAGLSAPQATLPPLGFLSEAQRNSQNSQNNYFAIEANNAANNALAQDAAAQQRAAVGPGAPNITFNPQIFNPGNNVVSNQSPISVTPTVAPTFMTAPSMPYFGNTPSAFATPVGSYGRR